MGFCRYCGEISVGKCTRCGGRSVESTISSMGGGVSVIDKWQSQYEDTILISKEIFNNTSKRIPVTQSTFYDTIRKACACCSSVLDHKTPAVIEGSKTYCQECHLRLFNKGNCLTCNKIILYTQKFIEYGQGVWHSDCFNCFNCNLSLTKNPLVDLKNRPCCELCFLNQSRKPIQKPIQLSTQGLSSIKTQLPTPHSSPIQSQPTTPDSTQSTSTTTIAQRPCHSCKQPLGDSSSKKVRMEIEPGRTVLFHKTCFVCSKCKEPFRDGQCATDGHSFYHPHCHIYCQACDKPIQGDAFLFNQQKYHFGCFKCFASGCSIKLGDPVFEVNSKPYCQACHQFTLTPKPSHKIEGYRPRTKGLSKLGGFNKCPRCKENISFMDDTPGPFASHWHKKCLCCAKCSKQLDSSATMRQGSQQESLVYCRTCIN